MPKIRVFINGFGRIGRLATRILLEDDRFELVGINDLYSYEQMAYLLKYDSLYPTLTYEIKQHDDTLIINYQIIKLFSQANPKELDIASLNIDVVLQCSGLFLTLSSNQPFIDKGVKRVIVSAPPSDAMPTYIMGVNHTEYQQEPIISNSSCSANAIVPIFEIIDNSFGIESAMMSMYHSYTSHQHLLDSSHYATDVRRARSATQNIIPLSSGAAQATAYFLPHLADKLHAKSIRVPIPATTLYDLSIKIKGIQTPQEINTKLHIASQTTCKNILQTTRTINASDHYIQNPHSATINLPITAVVGDMIRVSAWQDNEYGYARRLVDMVGVVSLEISQEQNY